MQPWSAPALRQAALTPSTSCSPPAVLGIAQPLTEASSEHGESQGAPTAPARDSARAVAQPQCPSVTASSPSPHPTPPAGPPRRGACCARQGGGGSVRNSTIVTIPTVTRRARRQVVGPTPKPHCRRQYGNAARAAALIGPVFPTPMCQGRHQGGRGSPAPARTSARALACGSERRTDRRSPLSLQGERRIREGVFSHPRSTFLPQPHKCVEGTRSHTCAPDEGTPPRRGAGPAEWICTGKQPPRARARRPTFGPPRLQLGSPTRARTQEGPLGARRWRSPLLASGQLY